LKTLEEQREVEKEAEKARRRAAGRTREAAMREAEGAASHPPLSMSQEAYESTMKHYKQIGSRLMEENRRRVGASDPRHAAH